MYLSYEQVTATAAVKTVADLVVPPRATHAELQARTAGIAFTMDGATNPTATVGMILAVAGQPKEFLVQDLQKIRFMRQAAIDATLNIHYIAGRNV